MHQGVGLFQRSDPKRVILLKISVIAKNTTESEFQYGDQIRYGGSKTLQRGLKNACFLSKAGRKTIQTVKNYGGSKILRIRVP